jgi:hypothetical protein
MNTQLPLYDALNATYLDKEGADKHLNTYGYKLDHELSTPETKVWYNGNDKKLLLGYRGTQNFINDIPVDASLAFGQIRNTSQYKDAVRVKDSAKQKYNPTSTVHLGHSKGASVASAIGDDDDTIYTFNKGNSLLGNSTKTKKNEKSYRIKGDLVSIVPDRNTTTINNNKYIDYLNPWWYNRANAHSTKHLKNSNIYI